MTAETGQPTEVKTRKSEITVDVIRQCWDDNLGDCIIVRPDCDAFNLVEVVQHEDGKDGQCIFMKPEMAKEVAFAILDCAGELTARESEEK